jgi:hypothetical protein
MAKRRTGNTMAKRRTGNTMAKRKRTTEQTTIYKSLHRKLKIKRLVYPRTVVSVS